MLCVMSRITEGTMPFQDGETWYRVTEPDAPTPGALPLVVLHGGPGMAHDYLRNLAALADETGRTVVHHDQFGCGRSSHRPDAPTEYWTPQLFVDEYAALVDHLGLGDHHVLGQSWGGMLGSEIAVRQPEGLRSLAICNSPASMQLWVEGAAELRAQLPEDVQAPSRGTSRPAPSTTPSTSLPRRCSTSATCAASSPCHRTSSTPRPRWSRSRRCTTP